MNADTDIEIYETPWTKAPNSKHCVTSIEMPKGSHPPMVGDVISVIIGKAPIDYRVTARTHLATDIGRADGKSEWQKMWVFVEKV